MSCIVLLTLPGSLWATPAATVNGVQIPYDRYIAAVESMVVKGQKGAGQPAGAAALARMISDVIMIQLAEEDGAPVTDEQLDKRMRGAEKTGALDAAMKSRHISADEYREEQRGQQAFVNFISNGVLVTAGEVEDFYYKNKDKYNQPEKVRIAVILAKDISRLDQAAAELAKGTSFADVASKYSEDAVSQKNGGMLGLVFKGQPGVPPAITETAFTLKAGRSERRYSAVDCRGAWDEGLAGAAQIQGSSEIGEHSGERGTFQGLGSYPEGGARAAEMKHLGPWSDRRVKTNQNEGAKL